MASDAGVTLSARIVTPLPVTERKPPALPGVLLAVGGADPHLTGLGELPQQRNVTGSTASSPSLVRATTISASGQAFSSTAYQLDYWLISHCAPFIASRGSGAQSHRAESPRHRCSLSLVGACQRP